MGSSLRPGWGTLTKASWVVWVECVISINCCPAHASQLGVVASLMKIFLNMKQCSNEGRDASFVNMLAKDG